MEAIDRPAGLRHGKLVARLVEFPKSLRIVPKQIIADFRHFVAMQHRIWVSFADGFAIKKAQCGCYFHIAKQSGFAL